MRREIAAGKRERKERKKKKLKEPAHSVQG